MATKNEIDQEAFAYRGETLERIARAIGLEKVEAAMSDPQILALVNFCCQGVVDEKRAAAEKEAT